MTVIIACLIWLLWPLAAFGGGLLFVPLASVAGLLLLPRALPVMRLRPYMAPVAVFFIFAAVSVVWSPRPFALVEIDPGGDFHIRSDVLRIGMLFVALASMLAAAARLGENAGRMIHRFAMVALLVQIAVCVALAVFEEQALDLFAPMMATRGDGVQNITRNNQIMAMAAPLLVLGLTQGRSRLAAVLIAALVVGAQIAVFLYRGVDAGLLALALACGAIVVVSVLPRHGFRVLGAVIAVLVLVMPLIVHVIAGGMEPDQIRDSITWRLGIWDRTMDEIAGEPIRGNGVGVLRTINETIPGGPLEGRPLIQNHSHNMPLQLWAETGAVGAVLVAAAIFLAGWRMPAPRDIGRAGLRAAGLIGAMTAIACVSYDLWNSWWWSVGGLLAVLAVVAPRTARPSGSADAQTAASQSSPGGMSRDNNFHLMRLLFALMVVAYHLVALPPLPVGDRAELHFAHLAEIGVQGFFVISGYLVYASLRHSRSLADYASKRVRRLYPAYATIVILCAGAALVLSPTARSDLEGVARYLGWNLVFLNFMEPGLPGVFESNRFGVINGALWTLKIEVMFYLILPLLAFVLRVAGGMRWTVMIAIYVAAETWRLGLPRWGEMLLPGYLDHTLSMEIARQLPGQMAFFITGMALYDLRDRIRLRSVLPLLAMIALAASVLHPAAQPLRPLALGVVTIWLAAGIPRLFNAARFGDLSYGVYIIHFPVIQLLVAAGLFISAPWVAGGAAIAGSLAGAWLLWRLVERPSLRRDSAYRADTASAASGPASQTAVPSGAGAGA